MCSAQVSVLEEANKVSLRCLLQGEKRMVLKTEINLYIDKMKRTVRTICVRQISVADVNGPFIFTEYISIYV
jgi:hypothetical protein